MQRSENSPARLVDALPEAFVSNVAISREVSRRVRSGRLRKLASRLYTSNLTESPEALVRRNLWNIVAGYFPGALVADRTALELAPAADGAVFLVAPQRRAIRLPGVTLHARAGAPLPSDQPFLNGLFLSSTARAYLDNLRPSRARATGVPRTLARTEIETRLDDLIRRAGVDAANRLRDEARQIAPTLSRATEAETLDALIGALAGTREARLTSPTARARRRGKPYDARRLRLFESLHAHLRNEPPTTRPAARHARQSSLSFYDAYFSNFIEGTEFAVDEAASIVFEGRIPRERPEDAHDIAGVYRLVSDATEMRRTPADAAGFLGLLRDRHRAALGNRPEVLPGQFKTARNQARGAIFVRPEDVVGTLERAFALRASLETAFQRAAYMLFVVSEVHPFADGNGRIARIMMNAELIAAGEERIVIPTVYRGNYLAALRALTHNGIAEPLVRMLDFAQRWTAAVDWRSVAETAHELDACNAFLESELAEQDGRRLRMPS